MEIISIQQHTKKWHDFRACHVMATDAAIIIGPAYCTPQQLYKQKKDPNYQPYVNKAMKRGSALEGDARIFAEQQLGMKFPPAVVESLASCDFGASLDGLNEGNRCLLEIKVPGDAVFKDAIIGKLPAYWLHQIQWQLMCTGYQMAYLCIYDGFDGKIIEITRDNDLIENMIRAASEWWSYFIKDELPPASEDDYVPVEIDKEQLLLINRWEDAVDLLNESKAQEEELRKQIYDLGDDSNCEIFYEGESMLKMCRIRRKGNVDWEALCKSANISESVIETFRKKDGIGYWKLTRTK